MKKIIKITAVLINIVIAAVLGIIIYYNTVWPNNY